MRCRYVADTRSLHILAFDYNLEAGTISNRRVFIKTSWDGRPDGMCVDEEGFVWSAK
jgi:sugar lactone lactonase YvrE